MADQAVRTHVVLPREVVESIDRTVGRRGRSRFLAEAAEEKLARLRRQLALERVAGSLRDVAVPGWETAERAAEWVTASRRADEEQARRAAERAG